MKEKDLFAMDLQFFAEEGDSADVNEAEVVEQPEGDNAGAEPQETEGVTDEAPAEPQFQSDKANAAFAEMRRRMEAAERRAAEVDSMYAKQFGGYTNPETGQPIRSAADYVAAMAAQERIQARQKLQENNIDPSIIDSMIANSPVVRQAEAVTAELNELRTQQMIEEDFKKVLAIDPTMTSKEDIFNDPSYGSVVEYVQTHPGMRFDEAYKLVNFDRLSSSRTAAARQAVVNQVKGQSHLSNAPGLTPSDSLEDIPASMLENFKDRFPDKSVKELKALYNKVLKTQKG